MMSLFGYVYAVKFSNGVVKVGMSKTDPRGRIKSHHASMRRADIDVVIMEEIISDKIPRPRRAETFLIEEGKRISGVTERTEWFRDIGIDWVTPILEEYQYYNPVGEALAEEEEIERRHDHVMQKFVENVESHFDDSKSSELVSGAAAYELMLKTPLGGKMRPSMARAVGGEDILADLENGIETPFLTIKTKGIIMMAWVGGCEVYFDEESYEEDKIRIEEEANIGRETPFRYDWENVVHV